MEIAIDNGQINNAAADPLSRSSLWTGRIVSGIPTLFLLLDGVAKLFRPQAVIDGTVELGYQESVIVPLGIVLTAATLLYSFPRTAFLGAVLLTGYLGGAVATHVRVGNGAFPVLFPVIIGGLLWLGLYLRDARLRSLVPFRTDK